MSVLGAADTALAMAFSVRVLVPTLHPGQRVLMDGLSPHRVSRVRELIEAAECRLHFLPTFLPAFNPIELA